MAHLGAITFLGPTAPTAAQSLRTVGDQQRTEREAAQQAAPHPPPTWLGPDTPQLEFTLRPVNPAMEAAPIKPASKAWLWWLAVAAVSVYLVTREK